MIEAGTYLGKLAKWGSAESKTGTPYVYLDFTVGHRARDGQWAAMSKTETRTVYLYTSDAAYPYSAEKLTALGFNGLFNSGMDFSDAVKNDGVALECAHEEYDGKTREKWNLAYGGDGYEHTALDADRVRALNSRWKAEHGTTPTGAPAAPPTGPDIPF